jgi:IMP cyclohydrolase
MAQEIEGFDPSVMTANMEALAANPYPGRGIVLGVSEGGEQAVQAYWVMGRSENSRNRVLVENEDGSVRTEAFDPSKVLDPSLIIYNAMRTVDQFHSTHVVSNGDQTDTLVDEINRRHARLSLSERFLDALIQREFEPDAPNFTPRITATTFTPLQPGFSDGRYNYSLIKRNPTTGGAEHTFGGGSLGGIPEGTGICFHTYNGDGDPLPAFEGSPFAVPVQETAEEIAGTLWESLDAQNRVAIVAKTINLTTGQIAHHIINQLAE